MPTFSGVSINNSTVSDNTADGGGGISNYGFSRGWATTTITNSTVSGNSATNASGGGGGISNTGEGGIANLTIAKSTLSGNSAIFGGGINNNVLGTGGARLSIGDTILKAGATGANINSSLGNITSLGYNLE